VGELEKELKKGGHPTVIKWGAQKVFSIQQGRHTGRAGNRLAIHIDQAKGRKGGGEVQEREGARDASIEG